MSFFPKHSEGGEQPPTTWNDNGFSLHDCYLYGVAWDCRNYSLSLDIDFIVEWLAPESAESNYSFKVCKSQLLFKNIDGTRIDLDWEQDAPLAQIRELVRGERRETRSGLSQWHWVLELSSPGGEISLWATGVELTSRDEPKMSPVQSLRIN